MPKPSLRFPALSPHKASGQAVVRIAGKDVYCGPWGSTQAEARYRRAISAWLAGLAGSAEPASAPHRIPRRA
jgi:hypothetical protein